MPKKLIFHLNKESQRALISVSTLKGHAFHWSTKKTEATFASLFYFTILDFTNKSSNCQIGDIPYLEVIMTNWHVSG